MNTYSSFPIDAITITGCEGCNGNCNSCYLTDKPFVKSEYKETEYSKWLKDNCPF